MTTSELKFCNCDETRFTDYDGNECRMPVPRIANFAHDCRYAAARGALSDEALRLANLEVPDTMTGGGRAAWTRAYSRHMERLAAPLLGQ